MLVSIFNYLNNGSFLEIGHPAQGLRVGSSGFLSCEDDALIGTNPKRFVHFPGIESPETKIALGTNHEESRKQDQCIMP